MITITNPRLVDKLMIASMEQTTKFTIEKIREILEIKEKVGVKTLNLIIPELKFTNLNYKGTAYVKVSMRITPDEYRKRLDLIKNATTIIVGGNGDDK